MLQIDDRVFDRSKEGRPFRGGMVFASRGLLLTIEAFGFAPGAYVCWRIGGIDLGQRYEAVLISDSAKTGGAELQGRASPAWQDCDHTAA